MIREQTESDFLKSFSVCFLLFIYLFSEIFLYIKKYGDT